MSDSANSSETISTVDGGITTDGVYRAPPSDDEKPVSMAVVEALAEAKGVPPVELDAPLYDVVDIEAIDELFAPDGDGRGRVVFTVDDYEVTVTADRSVYVQARQ